MTNAMNIPARGHLTDAERLALRVEALQQAVTLHAGSIQNGTNPEYVNEQVVNSAAAFATFLDRP